MLHQEPSHHLSVYYDLYIYFKHLVDFAHIYLFKVLIHLYVQVVYIQFTYRNKLFISIIHVDGQYLNTVINYSYGLFMLWEITQIFTLIHEIQMICLLIGRLRYSGWGLYKIVQMASFNDTVSDGFSLLDFISQNFVHNSKMNYLFLIVPSMI